jgi:hypothetical protein
MSPSGKFWDRIGLEDSKSMFDLSLSVFFLYPVQTLVVGFLISIEIG